MNNVELEKTLLACCLSNPNALRDTLFRLTRDDFVDARHRIIYDALNNIYNNNLNPDIVILKQEIDKIDNTNIIDSACYAELITFPTTIYYIKLIDKIKDVSQRVKLKNLALKINEKAEKNCLDALENEIKEELENIRKDNEFKIKPICDNSKRIEDFYSKEMYLPTHLKNLNNIMNGFFCGSLIVLGARPSVGKSALALNFASYISKTKYVLMFSLEMTVKETILRLLSEMANFPLDDIIKGKLDLRDVAILNAKLEEVYEENKNLFLVDNEYNFNNIVKTIKRYKELNKLDFVIIDYLQLIENKSEARERHLQIAEITRTLKKLAQELNIPILILSQLSRNIESRTNKTPILSDLRESGSIEQDANMILFINKDENENYELIVAKNRNGRTGRIRTTYLGSVVRFID